MRKMYFFFSLIAGILACTKPEIEPLPDPPATPPASSKLKVLWQRPVRPDTVYAFAAACHVWDGSLIYGYRSLNMCNGDNGAPVWGIDPAVISGSFHKRNRTLDFGDKTIHRDGHKTFCINNKNGDILWMNEVESSTFDISRINDHVYGVQFTGMKPYASSESIVRTCHNDGNWDTLFTAFAKSDGFYPNIRPPSLWVRPDGDSILIFIANEAFKPGMGPSPTGYSDRIMVYALDLKTRQLIWTRENLDPGTIAHNGPLITSNNQLYVNTGFKIFCLDAFTGQEIWRSERLSNGCFYANLVTYENLIIAQADEIGMYALDKNTGALVWYNKDTDGTVFEVLIHEGIVYCTSSGYSRLYAIRAATGETIWKERSPNRGKPKSADASFFDADIAIDPLKKVLYTSDKYYLMCIQLPE